MAIVSMRARLMGRVPLFLRRILFFFDIHANLQ